jgi:hypothetical protein
MPQRELQATGEQHIFAVQYRDSEMQNAVHA